MGKVVNLAKLKDDMEHWPKAWAGFDSDIATEEEHKSFDATCRKFYCFISVAAEGSRR